MPARISIITPSFRSSDWLKLCISSVADQGVELEHIVQDSCSDDGTQDWLPRDKRIKAFIEKDQGMYDAVNRGFHKASGEILAYINCDEQYLPGALGRVLDFFERNPSVDVVFADAVVVDETGGYVCDRKSLAPHELHTLLSGNLSFLTCSTFLRRSAWKQFQLEFDPGLRILGDLKWAMCLLRSGVKMGVLREFTTAFTETGTNLSFHPDAAREREIILRNIPGYIRVLRPLAIVHHRLRKLFAGAYRCPPHTYSIYTSQNPDGRRTFQVDRPTFRWVRSRRER